MHRSTQKVYISRTKFNCKSFGTGQVDKLDEQLDNWKYLQPIQGQNGWIAIIGKKRG